MTDFGVMSNGMPITEHGLTARLMTLMHVAEGAYSLTVLTREALYAARDPLGLRPLCLGRLDEGLGHRLRVLRAEHHRRRATCASWSRARS